ncbi:MAG: hypothetical protein WBC93_09725 [Sulfitobacter sp.]
MFAAQDQLIWIFLGAAAVLLCASLYYGDEARIARGIIARFFLTIAVPVAFLLGLPLLILSLFSQLDPRLWQALIDGLVIATGWLTTAIFTEQGKARLKAERMRDYHKAIYAEIGNTLASLWDEGKSEAYVAATLKKMQKDPDFVPFIPREQHDHIYNAIVQEIDVLPRHTINAIVAYYSLIKSITALADDMRGQGFRNLTQDRRILMYSDYSDMRKQAFAYGQNALTLILAFASGGPKGAETAARAISNPAVDRSDPSQGSA